MTMVPEAWQDNSLMSQDKQDFYRWISCSMEPWDGPGMYRLDQLLKAKGRPLAVRLFSKNSSSPHPSHRDCSLMYIAMVTVARL